MSENESQHVQYEALVREVAGREGRSVRDALRARARAHAVPLTAFLELTKRCNLSCYHCYVAGDRAEMGTERWLELIDELEAEGSLHISLTGGELGLRRDWLAIAQRVKQRHMTLTVLTNGTLFSNEDVSALASLRPFLVSVSLYGGAAAAHDEVTGVDGSFDRSIATLVGLRRHGVRCRIACTLMPSTLPQVSKIIELSKHLDCEYQFDPTVAPRSDGDASVLRYRLPAEGVRQFFLSDRALEKTREGRLAIHPGELPDRQLGNCGAGVASLHIESNGDLLACIGLRPGFGNVVHRPFREVWHGSQAERHRLEMQRPLDECLACDLRTLCTVRCPRLAVHETGTLSGKSTRACELAEINVELRNAVRALQNGVQS